jgi:hypothetical protein
MNDIIKRIRERVHNYRLKAWLLEGNERHGGSQLAILYAGHEKNRNYLTHIAFQPGFREEYRGRIWTWGVSAAARRIPGLGLVVIETEEGYYRRFRGANDFYVPFWVDGDIECIRTEDRTDLSDSIRDDLRKIRKQRYQYEISRDPAMFDRFYHQMYRPYIEKAHGNRAALISHEVMMNRSKIIDLLLIRKGDEYVAGEILLNEDRGVRSWAIGVLNGDYRHVREGAVGALYYYKVVYLRGRGISRYNVGASRAFLNDGVLQYKRKWGMKLTQPRPGGFWLRVPLMTDGAKAFFQCNPFIYLLDSELYGLVFINGSQCGEDVDCPNKRFEIPGLKELIFARFHESTSALN